MTATRITHVRCDGCRSVLKIDGARLEIRTPGEVGYRMARSIPSDCCPGADMRCVSMVRWGEDLVPFDDVRAQEKRAETLAAGFRLATSVEWYGSRSPRTDFFELARFIQHLRRQWGLPAELPAAAGEGGST